MAEIPAPLLQRLLQKRAASYSGGEPAPECELDCDEAQQATEQWLTSAPEAIEGDKGRQATIAVIQKLGDLGNSKERTLEILTREGGWNETEAQPLWEYEGLSASQRSGSVRAAAARSKALSEAGLRFR